MEIKHHLEDMEGVGSVVKAATGEKEEEQIRNSSQVNISPIREIYSVICVKDLSILKLSAGLETRVPRGAQP